MDQRTTFPILPSKFKIDYSTSVIFIGSCFASEIGSVMQEGKMAVMINPTGVVYNPVSVGNTIDLIIEGRKFSEEDLFKYNNQYISFLHYTDFTSEVAEASLVRINKTTETAHRFLKNASHLFVTFGTARVYRFKETGKIVSNCHKLPSGNFFREMLTIESIVENWTNILDRLHSFNKNLRVIFTISPVRHWKDSAHGNQVSKSVLFLAVEKLLDHIVVEDYFPAYELIMDDLRDYRYYADDMLHPSVTAINYIWKAFTDCYFDSETISLWKEVRGITKARNHRFLSDSPGGKKEFANNILNQIAAIEKKNANIDFSEERTYFQKIFTEK